MSEPVISEKAEQHMLWWKHAYDLAVSERDDALKDLAHMELLRDEWIDSEGERCAERDEARKLAEKLRDEIELEYGLLEPTKEERDKRGVCLPWVEK